MYHDIINAVISVVLLGCILVGPTANAEVAKGEIFCLQHLGPQDKPLWTICFAQNEMKIPDGELGVIEVIVSDIEAIKELVRSFAKPSCQEGYYGAYGSYATGSYGPPEVIICRKEMKLFLQEVKRFTDASTINSIDSLLLRI